MVNIKTQNNTARTFVSEVNASLRQFGAALVGRRRLAAEVSSAAAHFDGLIDLIERAGWEISRLEQMKHTFDETAQSLIAELIESSPDMSEGEQQSYLAPFRAALHQFAHLSQRERALLRAEYSRFSELHAQALQSYMTKT